MIVHGDTWRNVYLPQIKKDRRKSDLAWCMFCVPRSLLVLLVGTHANQDNGFTWTFAMIPESSIPDPPRTTCRELKTSLFTILQYYQQWMSVPFLHIHPLSCVSLGLFIVREYDEVSIEFDMHFPVNWGY